MKNSRNKITAAKILRAAAQIASFIFSPGLFISVWLSLKTIFIAAVSGNLSLSELYGPFLILIAVIPVTVIAGRFFCGYLCAFGSMQDLAGFISGKIFKRRLKIPEKYDRIFKYLKYLILFIIIAVFWIFGVTSSESANPWTVFGIYSSVSGWSSSEVLLSSGSVILLFIIASSFITDRFFCRYLCPLGGIFTLISGFRLFKLKKPRDKCGACGICTSACPMGINLRSFDTVTSGECIDCFKCAEACPRSNISADPSPAVAAAMSVIAISGLYYAGNILTDNLPSVSSGTGYSASSGTAAGIYTDGTYEGSAAGFRGTTTVKVTVENGYIIGIDLVSTADDDQFFNNAWNNIINDILSLGFASVDTVSGATYSSKGIIGAVENALSAADKISLQTETDTAAASETETQTGSSESSGQSDLSRASESIGYADGVYSGTGTGYRGETKISVTVSGGKITSIDIVSYEDDNEFLTARLQG